jgi:hypothetical protein
MTVEPQRLWSVTSLIGEGVPKPALVGWAGKVTAERAYDRLPTLGSYVEAGDRDGAIKWLTDARWETSGKAAARGTTVHGLIEQYALGNTPDVPEEMKAYDEQVRRYLDDHQPVFEAAEAPVYNLTYGYAGTMDSIQVVGGRRCIVDCKTTDKGPDARSRPPYPEIALQTVAYARCELVGVSPATMREFNRRRYYIYDPELAYEPMPELDGALALIVSPFDYQLVPVRIDDEVWEAWGHVREVARWQLDTSRRVLGPHVTAPAKEAVA